ncbi:hypothetical protein PoB_006559000 [Plakobranchus ocellatus]|uniref:Uncharacterized protein n=1 Tax=Plakobranchus ocellatus TaxID=259542 RepID=A0AAV4D4J4_9GAST|nr:hypothetical protein PoB_006559000 [Plakobranchus ocellatus]
MEVDKAQLCSYSTLDIWFYFVYSPEQSDLRLLNSPSGQGAGGGARTRDRRDPADPRADSLSTVSPIPPALMSFKHYLFFLQAVCGAIACERARRSAETFRV